MYKDTLASLFPNGAVDVTEEVFSVMLAAIGASLDTLSSQGDSLVNNASPYTADINGIALWEQALLLPSDSTLSLSQRQQRAAAKAFRLNGALTAPKYVNLFNLFSPSKSATFRADPPNYTVYGTFLIDDMQYYNDALAFILASIPAHIAFSPVFQTTSKSLMTSSSEVILIVSRDVFANGKNANVLDGSWNLDGSHLMDGSSMAGPTASSSAVITVTDSFQSAQYLDVQGFVLDGGRTLDGGWNLSGTTTQLRTTSIQKTFIVTTGPTSKPTASSQQTVTVTRFASGNNLPTLNGSWLLDGSQTLNGQIPGKASVTVNGVAV